MVRDCEMRDDNMARLMSTISSCALLSKAIKETRQYHLQWRNMLHRRVLAIIARSNNNISRVMSSARGCKYSLIIAAAIISPGRRLAGKREMSSSVYRRHLQCAMSLICLKYLSFYAFLIIIQEAEAW